MAITDTYTSVWLEPQNADIVTSLRKILECGSPVRLTLQPGDMTRYELALLPLDDDKVKISNDGREPILSGSRSTPLKLLVVCLSPGFCEDHMLLYRRDILTTGFVASSMKTRHDGTAHAITAAVNALWGHELETN